MSERKVLNKYFPPDFDPAKIPRRRMPKEEQHKVRLMTPFSMRCETCGDYVYKGKKFNARKERVDGEHYLGIQIFRFYIRCPKCSAEITFKTDPKNSDYVAEHGAQRNFEPWRDEKDVDEELRQEKEKEEENNPMKALENRTIDSKREMDILDALDEIRTKNAMNERVDADTLLHRILESKVSQAKAAARIQEEEDEAIARAIFNSADGGHVRRILDEEAPSDALPTAAAAAAALGVNGLAGSSLVNNGSALSSSSSAPVVVKRKATIDLGVARKKVSSAPSSSVVVKKAAAKPSLLGVADYDSD